MHKRTGSVVVNIGGIYMYKIIDRFFERKKTHKHTLTNVIAKHSLVEYYVYFYIFISKEITSTWNHGTKNIILYIQQSIKST